MHFSELYKENADLARENSKLKAMASALRVHLEQLMYSHLLLAPVEQHRYIQRDTIHNKHQMNLFYINQSIELKELFQKYVTALFYATCCLVFVLLLFLS